MSTSPANSSDAQSTKKKRACDYCRLKRVICHPQSNGEPCPRCLEKGVCTTTISTTRKPRGQGKKALAKEAKRRQEAEAAEAEASKATSVSVKQAQPSIPPSFPDDIYFIPGDLMRDALEMAEMEPGGSPGLSPVPRQRALLDSRGWDILALAPHDRVLALCLLAMASLVSVDPTYVGYHPQGGRFPDAHTKWETISFSRLGDPEMIALGQRRRAICAQLYGEAMRQATLSGTMSHACRENVTSCGLLNMLDVHKSESNLPWATAFVWQLRTLTELDVADKIFEISDGHGRELASFQWRLGLLLLVSNYAISAGKNLPSVHDEELICVVEPPSIEDAIVQASTRPGAVPVIQLMHSTKRNIQLIRDALEKVVGHARRRPPDDLTVMHQIVAAEQHHPVLMRVRRLIYARVVGPGQQVLLHTTAVAFCVLTVALYNALHSRAGEVDRSTAMTVQLVARARALAVRAIADAVREIRSIVVQHWLPFTQRSGFEAWAKVLVDDDGDAASLDSGQANAGEFVVSVDERIETLELRKCIMFTAFIGVDRTEFVPAIDAKLDLLRARLAQQRSASHNSTPCSMPDGFTSTSSRPSTESWGSDPSLLTPSLDQSQTPSFWISPPNDWDFTSEDWMSQLAGSSGLSQTSEGHAGPGAASDFDFLHNVGMAGGNMDASLRAPWG
uniref:Phosphoribosylglycinamide synthetase n=1 Tax=Schizophyllum commune (strain H4-8 / FGSC 9210) TaxID=578458 RepID=D8QC98_SCHCM